MSVAFFDVKGLIHKEFIPIGQIATDTAYKGVLD